MNRIRTLLNWIGVKLDLCWSYVFFGAIVCVYGLFAMCVIIMITEISGSPFVRAKMLFSCSSHTEGFLLKTVTKVEKLNVKAKKRRDIFSSAVRLSRTEVAFNYQVNGTNYQSSRYYPGTEDDTFVPFWECLEDTKSEVTAGERYTVYYNPSKPSEAFMVRGWPKGEISLNIALWGAAVAFGLIALKSRLCFFAIGLAIYGPLLFLFGPTNVLVSHLHLHLLVVLALGLVVWALERLKIVELNLFKDASANP